MLVPLLTAANAVIIVVLFGLVVASILRHREIESRAALVVWAAFSVRVVAATVVDRLGVFAGQGDFFDYNNAYWYVARQFRMGDISGLAEIVEMRGPVHYAVESAVYAPVYAVFGHEPLFARFVTALLGTVFVFNIYRIGVTISDRKVGLYAAVIAAFFPYWIYLSTLLYRDMLIMLILSQLIYKLLQMSEGGRFWSSLGWFVGLTAVTAALRPPNLLPVGLAFLAVPLSHDKVRQNSTQIVLLGGIAMGALWYIVNRGFRGDAPSISNLAEEREFLTRGGGSYLGDVIYHNLWEAIAFLPVGAAYFLLVPLPGIPHNTLALLAVVQNLVVWYPIVILSVFGARDQLTRDPRPVSILVMFALAGVAGYGMVEGNMGPALRHRSQFQLTFVVLAAVALRSRFRFDTAGHRKRTVAWVSDD